MDDGKVRRVAREIYRHLSALTGEIAGLEAPLPSDSLTRLWDAIDAAGKAVRILDPTIPPDRPPD